MFISIENESRGEYQRMKYFLEWMKGDVKKNSRANEEAGQELEYKAGRDK